MRGLFTAGVMDVMLEHHVQYDGIIGVSAGATFGCNYKSLQPGRVLRYNLRFRHHPRYMSLYSLLTTGNFVGAEFSYHILPEKLDLFDFKTYADNPAEFEVVCTDASTGEPVYHRIDRMEEGLDWIRASASLPILSTPVRLEGRALLDGGISDSIPLRHFQQKGYQKCVVVLTQPSDFKKNATRLMPLFRAAMKKYPRIIESMARRHEMYNQELDYLREQASAGHALLIHPKDTLPIGRVQQSASRIRQVYRMGREAAEEVLPQILEFLR